MTYKWEIEPDKLDFVDKNTGYKCAILRHPRHRTLNGYVILPEDHIFYGKVFDEVWDNDELRHIKVHGGVNFAGYVSETLWSDCEELKNCDGLKIFQESDYMIGFDCGHYNDFVPGDWFPSKDSEYYFEPSGAVDYEWLAERGIYRDIEYVMRQCKKLAKQLKKIDEEKKNV
jgi:hypothetical protein